LDFALLARLLLTHQRHRLFGSLAVGGVFGATSENGNVDPSTGKTNAFKIQQEQQQQQQQQQQIKTTETTTATTTTTA
jgi:hypothetical protein